MVGSTEIEHFARDYFKILFGATTPAARITSIEADHDRRSHCIDVGFAARSGRSLAIRSPTRRAQLHTVPALTAPPMGSNLSSRSTTLAKGASAAMAVT